MSAKQSELHAVIIQIELWPVDRLILNSTNPRTHTAEQVAQIAASIREFGFVCPILVDTDGTVIAGEGRLRAAKSLEMKEVPVIVLGHLSEAQRCALAIADNQLALNAAWDEEMLRQQLALLSDDGFDLAVLGFNDDELAQRLEVEDRARFRGGRYSGCPERSGNHAQRPVASRIGRWAHAPNLVRRLDRWRNRPAFTGWAAAT
jgi:hypothetical protein